MVCRRRLLLGTKCLWSLTLSTVDHDDRWFDLRIVGEGQQPIGEKWLLGQLQLTYHLSQDKLGVP